MKYDDESLDRALLALPLEEPPASLRAAILANTAYRPAPIFSMTEIAAASGVAAVLIWLGLAMAPQIAMAYTAVFSNVTLLAWLAAGVATAVALEFLTLSQPRYAPVQRAKSRPKP